MGTTAFVVEMLIAGFEALLWILIVLLKFVDLTNITNYTINKEWIALSIVILLSFVYALGVLIDRLADTVLDWPDKELQRRYVGTELDANALKLYVMNNSEGITKFLDYVRSRTRVARTTIVNIAIIIMVFLFVGVKDSENLNKVINIKTLYGPLFGVLILLLALSIYSWWRISVTFYTRLKQAYEIIQKEKEEKITITAA